MVADAPASGDDDGGGEQGEAGGDPRATLGWIQQHVFGAICAVQCHLGAAAPKGLQLDSSPNAHANLVGIPSVEMPDLLRVKPGDPAQSYLVVKIVPSDARRSGERMPRNGPPYLADEQIEAIRQWIARGAAREP